MSPGDGRGAIAALTAARPVLARLDAARHPEENAADLLEMWANVEMAFRSMLGGSSLSGQQLIREVRQRNLITLDQAHSTLELLAVVERTHRADYLPTADDLAIAREAFRKLDGPLAGSEARTAPRVVTDDVSTVTPMSPAVSADDLGFRRKSGAPGRWIGISAVLLLAGAAGYFAYARRGAPGASEDLQHGIALYAAGQRDSARAIFGRIVVSDPQQTMAHVYLGRLARETQDWKIAGSELGRALELEPGNGVARREFASFFLARGQANAADGHMNEAAADFDAARRNYVEALKVIPDDRSARGFLGCSLLRLGRTDEGTKWLGLAGDGPWAGCARTAAPPGAMPAPSSQPH